MTESIMLGRMDSVNKIINDYNFRLCESVSLFSNHTFLICNGEEITYQEFEQQLCQVNSLLKTNGISENDVITVISDNSAELAAILFGTIIYGAVINPINPKLLSSEIQNIVNHSGSKLVISTLMLEVQNIPIVSMNAYRSIEFSTSNELAQLELNDSGGLLVYTSGTTGYPKGVLLHKENILANIMVAIEKFELNDTHTKLCVLPLYHTFGFISDVGTMLFSGGKVILLETFNPVKVKQIEESIQEYNVNSFSAVPLIFSTLLKLRVNLRSPSMKYCISGSAPLHPKLCDDFLKAYDFPILPAYGLTETTCFCNISTMGNLRRGSIGKPANISIKVVSEDEEELGANLIGELMVIGASVMSGGYYKNKISCYSAKHPGYFLTGDLGYYDKDGYFYLTGRKKNMVIRGGEKVYLEEIDRELAEFPGLRDYATIRVGDKEVENIVCCIVLEDDSSAKKQDIYQFLLERVGKLKSPDYVEFIDYIPRTATNKVRIIELQKLFAVGEAL
jgi:long-chain acyl-CoA synthetase